MKKVSMRQSQQTSSSLPLQAHFPGACEEILQCQNCSHYKTFKTLNLKKKGYTRTTQVPLELVRKLEKNTVYL